MKYFFLLIFLAYNINLKAQTPDIGNDCSEALKSIIASLDPKGAHRQAAEEFLNAQVELTQQRLLWAHLKYLAELKRNDPKINAQTHKIEDGILRMLSQKHNRQIETNYNNLSQRLALSELSDDLLQIVQDQKIYEGDEQQLYKLNHSDLFMIHTLGKLETDLLNGRSAQGNLDNSVNKNTLINLATQINSSLGVTNQKSHASSDIESHINTTTKYIVDLEIKAKSAFNKMFDGQGVPDICQKNNENSSQSCSKPIVKFGSLYEMFQLSQTASQMIETKFYSDIKEDLYKNLYYCSHYPHVCADKVQACTKTCQAGDSICHKKCMGEDIVIKDRSFKCAPYEVKKTTPITKPVIRPIPESPINPIIQTKEKNIKISNTNTSHSVVNNISYNYTITNTNNQITSAPQIPNKAQTPIIIIKDNSEERAYSVNTIAGDPNVYVISIDKKQALAPVVPSPNPFTPAPSPKSNEKAADPSSEKKECKDIPGCHMGFTFTLDLKVAEKETNKAIDFQGITTFEYADDTARGSGIPKGYYLAWTIDGNAPTYQPSKEEQKQMRAANDLARLDKKINEKTEKINSIIEELKKIPVTETEKIEPLQLAIQENNFELKKFKAQKDDLQKRFPTDVQKITLDASLPSNIPCLYEAEKVNFENILRNQPNGNYTVKLTLYSPEGEEILSETQTVKMRAAASPSYDPNKIGGGSNSIGTGIQVH